MPELDATAVTGFEGPGDSDEDSPFDRGHEEAHQAFYDNAGSDADDDPEPEPGILTEGDDEFTLICKSSPMPRLPLAGEMEFDGVILSDDTILEFVDWDGVTLHAQGWLRQARRNLRYTCFCWKDKGRDGRWQDRGQDWRLNRSSFFCRAWRVWESAGNAVTTQKVAERLLVDIEQLVFPNDDSCIAEGVAFRLMDQVALIEPDPNTGHWKLSEAGRTLSNRTGGTWYPFSGGYYADLMEVVVNGRMERIATWTGTEWVLSSDINPEERFALGAKRIASTYLDLLHPHEAALLGKLSIQMRSCESRQEFPPGENVIRWIRFVSEAEAEQDGPEHIRRCTDARQRDNMPELLQEIARHAETLNEYCDWSEDMGQRLLGCSTNEVLEQLESGAKPKVIGPFKIAADDGAGTLLPVEATLKVNAILASEAAPADDDDSESPDHSEKLEEAQQVPHDNAEPETPAQTSLETGDDTGESNADPGAELGASTDANNELARLECDTPAYDEDSKDWITAAEAADALGHKNTKWLEQARTIPKGGRKNNDGRFGVDAKGRIWRKSGRRIYYYRPSIAPKGAN